MTAEQPADRPMVRMLSMVACNRCRRDRGDQLRRTGHVEPVPESGTCPHGNPLRTAWADGFGPGSEPPEDSGYDRTPPV
ncbi:hypothetical protein MXD62_19880 [Frankia sp. Mgl5]|uniref:hypothetical protein n=1 Tax=Frankia sp. Mgl5 TaxID=2933793 RepID=UPI00200CD22E|nr:hypothetical protein [Frankia sp. Mgl5]MCK9929411.1 hypothetical protein [Frankia sp. Mgl5]